LKLAQSIPTIFQRGGSKPEVIFLDSSSCGERVFSMDYDWPKVAQSISAVSYKRGPIRKPTSGVLPPHGKRFGIY